METKIFDSLFSDLIAIAESMTGETKDRRFKAWAKKVEQVDSTASNGYAFEGDWINEGTVELPLEPSVFLVAFSHGSRRYNTMEYAVVLMDKAGELHPTEIMTNSQSSGWALRIRDQVARLLDDSKAESSPKEQFLATLRGRFPILSDDEIITAALNVYEMHTR